MARYGFRPSGRRATGPLLAVLALLATAIAGPVTSAAAAQGGAAGSRSASAGASRVAGPLEQAFAAARHLPASAVGGVRTGSLHQGSAGSEWAMASFVPSASAGQLAAAFADGAATGVSAGPAEPGTWSRPARTAAGPGCPPRSGTPGGWLTRRAARRRRPPGTPPPSTR